MKFVGLLLVIACFVPLADAGEPSVILRPRSGGLVSGTDQLIGRRIPNAYPIVVMRVNRDDSLWVVQPEPTMPSQRLFRARLEFPSGDETKFRVAVLMFSSPKSAVKYRPGQKLKVLPGEASMFQQVSVTLRAREPVLHDGTDRRFVHGDTGSQRN